MHGELAAPLGSVLAFALVFSRIAGVFVFIPWPGKDGGPNAARIVLALAITIALFPRWPQLGAQDPGIGTFCLWLLTEVMTGIAIGLMIAFIQEAFTFGAQVLSLQAGYAYASIVDPTTQADSEVLQVLATLMTGLLFFTTGLHRFAILALADSLAKFPPGSIVGNQSLGQAVIGLGSVIFSAGLRLSFPVIAVLLMIDVSVGLIGRINSQLQLTMHGIPAKMMAGLLMLTATLVAVPALYRGLSDEMVAAIRRMIGF